MEAVVVKLSDTSSAPINLHHFIVTHGYTHGIASMLDLEQWCPESSMANALTMLAAKNNVCLPRGPNSS
jgi:hypothetical protein